MPDPRTLDDLNAYRESLADELADLTMKIQQMGIEVDYSITIAKLKTPDPRALYHPQYWCNKCHTNLVFVWFGKKTQDQRFSVDNCQCVNCGYEWISNREFWD